MPGLPGGFFTFGHAHTTLSLRASEVTLQFLTVSLEFVVYFIPFFISSMAVLREVNFRARNERRRIYVTLGTGPF